MASEIPWVSCQFPTKALAQEAGLTLAQFEDVLYGACLLDWDAEGERMRRYAERFDAAEQVRIVGGGTDLTLSLAGRHGEVDDGRTNMPGGEFFYAPVEDSAERRDRVLRVPGGLPGARVRGHPARASRTARSSTPPRAKSEAIAATRCSTATRAHAGSASSGSAATRASRGR